MMPTRWDGRFLRMAREVASWSKDPGAHVGAVIVRPDRTVASMGYNGFPRIMDDSLLVETYCKCQARFNYALEATQEPEVCTCAATRREDKLARTIHAEMNALMMAKEPVAGFTVYIWPFLCCERCFVHLIQAGVTRIVAPIHDTVKYDRWQPSFNRVRAFANEINRAGQPGQRIKILIEEVYFDAGD